MKTNFKKTETNQYKKYPEYHEAKNEFKQSIKIKPLQFPCN